jgi:hypothetical protein
MDFMGSKRFLSVWCEIHATTNRQDALETMIASFPIGIYPPKEPSFIPFMTLAVPEQLAPREQKPNKPIAQGKQL